MEFSFENIFVREEDAYCFLILDISNKQGPSYLEQSSRIIFVMFMIWIFTKTYLISCYFFKETCLAYLIIN